MKLSLLLGMMITTGSLLAADYDVYVGTYTKGDSRGIYRVKLDGATGKLSPKALSATTTNPSFLALHPSGKYLYSVNETGPAGKVSAFSISEDSGALTFLNDASAQGDGTCHLTVDKTGRHVLAANYGGGSIAVFPVLSDGRLKEASDFVQHSGSGPDAGRQKGPHAHGIYVDEANRFVYVPDLGLDKVMIYKLNASNGKLTPSDPAFGSTAPGAGPRHFVMHPKSDFAYVITEMTCNVTAYTRDSKGGGLTEIQTISTLPEGTKVERGFSTAELEAHPSGKFLYGSNRGHNTIVVYTIDPKSGQLTLAQHISSGGKNPRAFSISPDGRWLIAANQDSANLVVFKIDQKTGKLSETGNTTEVPFPVSLVYRKK
ncbi:MAG TPA: lactonase family protein [Verrucomicrobiae bacterium]